jgi:hypothetical protein
MCFKRIVLIMLPCQLTYLEHVWPCLFSTSLLLLRRSRAKHNFNKVLNKRSIFFWKERNQIEMTFKIRCKIELLDNFSGLLFTAPHIDSRRNHILFYFAFSWHSSREFYFPFQLNPPKHIT